MIATHRITNRQYLLCLSVIYGLIWILLAIDPISRRFWALENIVVLVGLFILFGTRRWFCFSRVSYTLIFLFLTLHAIAAHYTYSRVPYDQWMEHFTGRTLNSFFGWERNHFDRAVHFLYGLLMMLPFREVFLHIAKVRWPFWSYLLPYSFVLSTSLVYELIEWAAAVVLGGDQGMHFLGTQGDVWDAHHDCALAGAGALVTTLALAGAHFLRKRDVSKEWAESQAD